MASGAKLAAEQGREMIPLYPEEQSVDEFHQKLLQFWRRHGFEVRPPATAEAIEATEASLGFRLPPTLRLLYLRADGGLIGDCILQWPSLRELVEQREYMAQEHPRAVLLLDCMISSEEYWVLGLPLQQQVPKASLGLPVWHSFHEEEVGSWQAFWGEYMRDPDRITFHPLSSPAGSGYRRGTPPRG